MENFDDDGVMSRTHRSMVTKVYYTYIPSIVGFLVCFASTSTVPAEAQLQAEFGVSARVSQLPFTFFILGLGCVSQMLSFSNVYLFHTKKILG